MPRHAEVIWREPVLKSLLNSILGHAAGKKTIIFIDGLDELTCVNYINISELDKLIDARRTYRKQESIFLPEQEPSETGPAENGITENESSLAPEEINPAQDTADGRKKTFAQHLSMIPTAEAHTTVASWIAAGNIPTNPAAEAAPPIQYATPLLSAAYVSHRLEDWPSLLFYILSNLATHLEAAKTVVEDSPILLKWLDNTVLWDRFVLLKEDIPRSSTLSEFMHPRGDLIRALRATPGSRRSAVSVRRCVRPGARPAPSRSLSPVSAGRASSMASFASASSY